MSDAPDSNVLERLRAAVESSPSGLLMIDADGSIVLVNREVERLFGYAREELLGRSVELLVPGAHRAAHPDFRARFLLSPRVRAMGAGRELHGVRKDGTEVPVEIGLTPVATAEGLFVISSIVDITARRESDKERRRLEEELRQSQKLEAIGRLAGGIAHDFNNILGVIVGYTEFALEAAGPDAAADLEEVLRAAQRGKELVERILRFSRRQDVERRPVDLGRIVEEVAPLLRATLPATIEIRLEVPKELPRVFADPTSVHQVLMNLATNGSHAMPSGGTLALGVGAFYVRDSFARAHPGLAEGAYLRLYVGDTGEGMDEQTRSRAFEPFFTTKGPGHGSGLGLALVHGIARENGGAAWLDSEVGRGTTVHCLFPIAAADTLETPSELPVASRGRGERVLFVDDEESLASLGARRLEFLGYRPSAVSDPEEAVRIFRAAPDEFDLVVTDLAMPRMDGLALARAVRAIRPAIPILLLSGNPRDADDERATAAGILRVLGKPITLEGLASALREALDAS